MLDGAGLSGPGCPAAGATPCYHAYWAAVSADGVFAFVDAGAGVCPAFFALAGPDSDGSQGTLTVVGVSTERATAWAPPGYGGAYSAAAGTVTLGAPGCAGAYRAVGEQIALPANGSQPAAGSATVAFVGTTPAECFGRCLTAGLDVVWDASGEGAASACRIRQGRSRG